MAITWPCRLSVAAYAALGRQGPAPRPECGGCGQPMAFDGRYPRQVRDAGVVYRIFVRRAYCAGAWTAPTRSPRPWPHTSAWSCPGRPPRSTPACRPHRPLRQPFAERSEALWGRLAAISVGWGGDAGMGDTGAATPSGYALGAVGAARPAAGRRFGADVPPAFCLANVMVGGRLLSTRVDLPRPIDPAWIGWTRGP